MKYIRKKTITPHITFLRLLAGGEGADPHVAEAINLVLDHIQTFIDLAPSIEIEEDANGKNI